MNQLYVYIYPLFFGFPSHLGHHRALSRVPRAIQQVLGQLLHWCLLCSPPRRQTGAEGQGEEKSYF